MKKCYLCAHSHIFYEWDGQLYCFHPKNSSVIAQYIRCEKERGDAGNCGLEAKLFEPKPPKPPSLWKRIWGGS